MFKNFRRKICGATVMENKVLRVKLIDQLVVVGENKISSSMIVPNFESTQGILANTRGFHITATRKLISKIRIIEKLNRE